MYPTSCFIPFYVVYTHINGNLMSFLRLLIYIHVTWTTYLIYLLTEGKLPYETYFYMKFRVISPKLNRVAQGWASYLCWNHFYISRGLIVISCINQNIGFLEM